MELRPKTNVDYKALNRGFVTDQKEFSWPAGKLWRLKVTDETDDEVKVHYIGWASQYDEWLPKEKVVHIPDGVEKEDAYGNLKQQIRIKVGTILSLI